MIVANVFFCQHFDPKQYLFVFIAIVFITIIVTLRIVCVLNRPRLRWNMPKRRSIQRLSNGQYHDIGDVKRSDIHCQRNCTWNTGTIMTLSSFFRFEFKKWFRRHERSFISTVNTNRFWFISKRCILTRINKEKLNRRFVLGLNRRFADILYCYMKCNYFQSKLKTCQ